jgi:hypothetical protein
MTHSSLITAIDTVRAYTSDPKLLVEVDIVMDPAESLMATHDVSIPNRQVWKRPTIVNHHNDGESHEVAVGNLLTTRGEPPSTCIGPLPSLEEACYACDPHDNRVFQRDLTENFII